MNKCFLLNPKKKAQIRLVVFEKVLGFFSKTTRRICANFFLSRFRRKHLFITTCIEKHCKAFKLTPSCSLLQSINVLEGMIPSKEDAGILDASHLQRLFVFALMWSIGATLELADR